MRLRSTALAVALALLGGACSRSAEVRYRVSYTVNDNGITRSASGVWSNAVRPALVPLADQYESEFHGEAIPLRLPGKGVLLLMPIGQQGSEGDAVTMVRQLFSHRASVRDSDRVGNTAEVAEMIGQSRPIRCERYAIPQPRREPQETSGDVCLNFTFIADPRNKSTFRRIEVEDGRFAGLDGVRLHDARVTITRDPVTRGLEQLLPWLPVAQEYWTGRLRTDSDREFFDQEFIYMRR